MVNELIKVELTNGTGFPRRFTVADGTKIVKGSILKLTDARTAIIASGSADRVAGIASVDKEADDGSTSISVWTDGIFEAKASGVILAGDPVCVAGIGSTNQVYLAPSTASGSAIIGYALETSTDAETINIRVRL